MKKGYEILAIIPAFAEAYQESVGKLDAYVHAGAEEEIEEIPEFLTKQDSIGIISIKGKLSNTNSPWAKFFGLAPYNDVREALVYAATDESIESILLDIDSPGGTVSGMTETADLISTVAQYKPVKAYSSGTMASAAYALGSRADTVSISDTAMAGSVGTILSLMTYEKHLEKEGITPHIIRSGKFKAVGGPMEELTSESKAYLQEQVDYTADIFLGSVVKERSLDLASISDIQSGKEFIGKKAVSVGLVDTIESFDDVMDKLMSSHEGDDMKRKYNKKALTEQQIAAIASGAEVVAGDENPDVNADAGTGDELSAEEQAALDATVIAEVAERKAELEAKEELTAEEQVELDAMGTDEDAGDAGDAEDLSAAAGDTSPNQDALVTYLKEQIASKDEEIVALKTEAITAEAGKVELDALKVIAVDATAKMRIALSLAAVDMTDWTVDKVLVEHASSLKSFGDAFKVGGVSRVTVDIDEEEKTKATVTKLHTAKVKAVGL